MFKKFKSAVTVGKIALNFATVPVTKDGTPTLDKQFAKYSMEVRLEETRRQVSRDTTKPMFPMDKRNSKKLRKP